MVNLTIDNISVSVPSGSTILQAAQAVGLKIPTLCYHPDQTVKANCRVCLVEVEGARGLQAACSQTVVEGMVVRTSTPLVFKARKAVVELILARHPQDCLNCVRNGCCELQDLAQELGIREIPYAREIKGMPRDKSTPSLVLDPDKCILCRRCLTVCQEVQTVNALGLRARGYQTSVGPAFYQQLNESTCVMCGQCTQVCPTGALAEREEIDKLLDALADPSKIVVTQMAPAVRVALAEEVGLPTGELDMLTLVGGLRRLGFHRVFHTNFTADLTIMEEGHELLERLNNGGTLPMLTSCSPGWINFIETFYPDLLDNLSTCKSPQQMFGALVKTYWAQKAGVDPAQIYSVSIMPCTAKKYEAARPEMQDSGYQDVDLVLTTREIGKLFRMAGIDLKQVPPSEFDPWMGAYTGAGVIFGATGGVMEAALRTVYEVVTGNELANLDFTVCRGMTGIKEAEVDLAGTQVKVAIAHGLGNARQLMERIRAGEADYHFVEIMACPGGCIGGGGQPRQTDNAQRAIRIEAIYQEDVALALRKSHENPEVKQLYTEFLGQPLGDKSHQLLHTHYQAKSKKLK